MDLFEDPIRMQFRKLADVVFAVVITGVLCIIYFYQLLNRDIETYAVNYMEIYFLLGLWFQQMVDFHKSPKQTKAPAQPQVTDRAKGEFKILTDLFINVQHFSYFEVCISKGMLILGQIPSGQFHSSNSYCYDSFS